jgi:hypothetical protein
MSRAHDARMVPGSLHELRAVVFGAPFMACAFVGSTVPGSSVADEAKIALPPIYGTALAPRTNSRDRTVEASSDVGAAHETQPAMVVQPVDPRFALIELPPETTTTGGYKRPHHAFGYRWQAAESWLRERGFDAQNCYLPMLRLHTKVNASGASGTLWVYGRCMFK